MSSLKVFTRHITRTVVIVLLLLITLLPSFAEAAQVTERSIALSSSSKGITGVTYTVNFTPTTAAGAFVLDFCSNTPVTGQPCTPPDGFNATNAASTTSGFTDVVGSTHKVIVAGTITTAEVSVELTGIRNPDNAGPLYIRILTYDTKSHANSYDSEMPGSFSDEGSVAVSITDTIGVSGSVLESMTFCAAKVSITADCANASANTPVLALGEPIAGTSTVALDTGHVSTSNMFTQISTNAIGGAVISLKSGVPCGGLKRVGSSTCDIAPAVSDGISEGQAKFGLKATTEANTGTNPSGVFQAINGYNNATYLLNWVSGNATGIGSPYGDPILNTNNAPANNKNVKLTFGASVNNSTPAGLYSADLILIATGKF